MVKTIEVKSAERKSTEAMYSNQPASIPSLQNQDLTNKGVGMANDATADLVRSVIPQRMTGIGK